MVLANSTHLRVRVRVNFHDNGQLRLRKARDRAHDVAAMYVPTNNGRIVPRSKTPNPHLVRR